jgi:lipopolysaccharide biosynthesis glycosyltransferase
LASSYLVEGGVVVLDDFLNELHPDLTRGMLEGLMAHAHLEPVAVVPRVGHIEEGGSKLVCVTRGAADAYLKALDAAFTGSLRPWQDALLGRPVRVYRHPMPTAAASEDRAKGESLTLGQSSIGRQVVTKDSAQAPQPIPPIVFCLHDTTGHYWVQTAVAMASVAQHARGQCHFHVLHDDTLVPQAVQRMQALSEQLNFRLDWRAVQLPSSVLSARLRRFGPGSLFRLMIPQLFRQEEQVIYLDSDLVCNGLNLAELAIGVPALAPVAAVHDPFIAVPARHRQALQSLGLLSEQYFNSGVMLWRPKLIEEDLIEAFDQFIAHFPDTLHPDQDFLNRHFGARAGVLDARFNTQAGLLQASLLQPVAHYQGKIVHFAGKLKPMDGSLSPGVLPFWMHAAWVPEVAACVGHAHYLYPVINKPNMLQRSKLQPV